MTVSNDYWHSGIKNYVPKFYKKKVFICYIESSGPLRKYTDLEVGLWYSVAENQIQNFRVLSQKTFGCSIWHPPILWSNQQSQYSAVQDNCAVLRLLLSMHWWCRNVVLPEWKQNFHNFRQNLKETPRSSFQVTIYNKGPEFYLINAFISG